MPNKLTELGELIAEREKDYKSRQQRIDRLEPQYDAGAFRRHPDFGAYVDDETGEENYQENTRQLGEEIEKLRKEYLDEEQEEDIADAKKRKQAQEFKDREATEKARGAEPIERSMIKKAADTKPKANKPRDPRQFELPGFKPDDVAKDLAGAKLAQAALREAAKSRLGKGALKKLGGKAMSPALQLMMLLAGPGAKKMLQDYEDKKKPVGMRPPEA
jgi:hypothetical protein